ncbi:MAG: hypothetical protein LPK07_08250 [Hymenobacteraceae bacterium]|nr:hypothetical protein [Hymenobacteraceae bacterium]MDX5481662.1 hypothetical protein [Hymenobacteraceae bacterium]
MEQHKIPPDVAAVNFIILLVMARYVKMILVLLSCVGYTAVMAQDVIVMKSGEQVIGKILHVGVDTVHYRYFSDTKGPSFALPKQQVAQLKLTAQAEPVQLAAHTYTDEETSITEVAEMRLQAKRDAKAYYKGRGIFLTTMGSTIIHPVAGLATGVTVAALPPNIESDYNPNSHLLKDPVYREAYQKQARKHRLGKAAAGLGAGLTILSAIYMVVTVNAF